MENNVSGICYICGEPLVWGENNENCFLYDYIDEEGTVIKEIKCKHCGTLYQYHITEENKADSEEDYISCGNQGFGECAHCGGIVAWTGDFMRSDFYDDPMHTEDNLNDEDDAIVRSCTCAHCGCSIEVWEPTYNEMKSGEYPYWNEYFKERDKQLKELEEKDGNPE